MIVILDLTNDCVDLPILEWLPKFRLKGSALPLSGSFGSVSLGAFLLTCYTNCGGAGEEEKRKDVLLVEDLFSPRLLGR